MPDVITFGEAMLRLAPPDFERLEQASNLKVSVGGSELTVAAGVARLGLPTGWVSRLPANALGRMAQNKAREFGVDTRHVVWTKRDRMGIYFVEYGASPRASGVLYDRSHSAISHIQPDEVDWAEVFKGARWFHTSGITPALSEEASAVTHRALRAAKAAGLTVSYDLNYRAKLWSADKARTNGGLRPSEGAGRDRISRREESRWPGIDGAFRPGDGNGTESAPPVRPSPEQFERARRRQGWTSAGCRRVCRWIRMIARRRRRERKARRRQSRNRVLEDG